VNIEAEIDTLKCGPIVRVIVDGDRSKAWEMTVRGAAVSTPMRRRYTIARAIEYVASKLPAVEPVKVAA
jgi:hypothetical protein